jgi:hypothetical protein
MTGANAARPTSGILGLVLAKLTGNRKPFFGPSARDLWDELHRQGGSPNSTPAM